MTTPLNLQDLFKRDLKQNFLQDNIYPQGKKREILNLLLEKM